MDRLIDLHDDYADEVEFLFVVIRDAGHPDAGTPAHAARLTANAPADARLRVICDSLDHYDVPFTTLFDAGGAVDRSFNAYPKRLVVLDASARITLDGGRGAGGGPSEWDLAALDRQLRSLLEPAR